jgi:hypothetical protein
MQNSAEESLKRRKLIRELAEVIGHELKTPSTLVNGFWKTLGYRGYNPSEDAILNQVDHLGLSTDLLEKLVLLAKLETPRDQPKQWVFITKAYPELGPYRGRYTEYLGQRDRLFEPFLLSEELLCVAVVVYLFPFVQNLQDPDSVKKLRDEVVRRVGLTINELRPPNVQELEVLRKQAQSFANSPLPREVRRSERLREKKDAAKKKPIVRGDDGIPADIDYDLLDAYREALDAPQDPDKPLTMPGYSREAREKALKHALTLTWDWRRIFKANAEVNTPSYDDIIRARLLLNQSVSDVQPIWRARLRRHIAMRLDMFAPLTPALPEDRDSDVVYNEEMERRIKRVAKPKQLSPVAVSSGGGGGVLTRSRRRGASALEIEAEERRMFFSLRENQPIDSLQVFGSTDAEERCPFFENYIFMRPIGKPGANGMALLFNPMYAPGVYQYLDNNVPYVVKIQPVAEWNRESAPAITTAAAAAAAAAKAARQLIGSSQAYNELRIFYELSRLIPDGPHPSRIVNFVQLYDWIKCAGDVVLTRITKTKGSPIPSNVVSALQQMVSKSVDVYDKPLPGKPLQMLIIEKAEGDVNSIVKHRQLFRNRRFFKSFLIQILGTLDRLQQLLRLTQYDMHLGNILYSVLNTKEAPAPDYLKYTVQDRVFVVDPSADSLRYIFKLHDFGLSFITYRNKTPNRTQVIGVRNVRMANERINEETWAEDLSGVYNPGYDVHKLGCSLAGALLGLLAPSASWSFYPAQQPLRPEDVDSDVFSILISMINPTWQNVHNQQDYQAIREALTLLRDGKAQTKLKTATHYELVQAKVYSMANTMFYRYKTSEMTPARLLTHKNLFKEFETEVPAQNVLDMTESLRLPADIQTNTLISHELAVSRSQPQQQEYPCAECGIKPATVQSDHIQHKDVVPYKFCSRECSDSYWSAYKEALERNSGTADS